MAPSVKKMAPKVVKKKAKTMEKPVDKIISKSKKKKKKNYTSFAIYLFKILKSAAKDKNQGISLRSMMIMNNFVNDMFENLAAEAGRLARCGKRNTMGSREIQTAIKLLVPGELGKHANIEGVKALLNYYSMQEKTKET